MASDNIRKRVCKACDRCRLKKSKCDGANPCSRCKQDNTICVFGERKKSQDKVYPKGYTEQLEQQQTRLVEGVRKLYGLVVNNKPWPGNRLKEVSNGHPLTHDILKELGLLTVSNDGVTHYESFEEDPLEMQRKYSTRTSTSPESDEQGQSYQEHISGGSSDYESSASMSTAPFVPTTPTTTVPGPVLATPSYTNTAYPPPPPQAQPVKHNSTMAPSHFVPPPGMEINEMSFAPFQPIDYCSYDNGNDIGGTFWHSGPGSLQPSFVESSYPSMEGFQDLVNYDACATTSF